MRKAETPIWKLAVGLVAAVALIVSAERAGTGTAIALVVVAFAALGMCAALWGTDSRDGRDWAPAGDDPGVRRDAGADETRSARDD